MRAKPAAVPAPWISDGDRTQVAARLIGPYLVGRRIGGGGMGEVYEATHRGLGRRVAIKLLRSGRRSSIERFFAEARLAASIQHRGIVEIFDVGADEFGRPYIVMERLEGADLALAMARGSVSGGDIVEIAIQIAEALAAAHARGVIHRDLKPENVFVVGRRDELRIKLLDFGVAKARDSELTLAGQVLGTPQYMSPEQHRGAAAADARSDLYSLGCILYEMVTGRAPFLGLGAEVLAKHHAASVTPPSARGAVIPARLEAIIMKLLRKRPGRRYHSADELLRALAPLRSVRHRARGRAQGRLGFAVSRIAVGIVAGLALTAAVGAMTGAQHEAADASAEIAASRSR